MEDSSRGSNLMGGGSCCCVCWDWTAAVSPPPLLDSALLLLPLTGSCLISSTFPMEDFFFLWDRTRQHCWELKEEEKITRITWCDVGVGAAGAYIIRHLNSSSLPLLHIMVDERESWCRLMRPSHGRWVLPAAGFWPLYQLLTLCCCCCCYLSELETTLSRSSPRRLAEEHRLPISLQVVFLCCRNVSNSTWSLNVTYAVRHSHKDEILTHNSGRRRGPPPSMRVVECYSFTVCTVLPRFFFSFFFRVLYIRSRFFLRTTRRAV